MLHFKRFPSNSPFLFSKAPPSPQQTNPPCPPLQPETHIKLQRFHSSCRKGTATLWLSLALRAHRQPQAAGLSLRPAGLSLPGAPRRRPGGGNSPAPGRAGGDVGDHFNPRGSTTAIPDGPSGTPSRALSPSNALKHALSLHTRGRGCG